MPKKHFVCGAGEIPAGSQKIVRIGSRSVGVFNVGGDYHALLNLCPHAGGRLCEGPVGGTNLPVGLGDGYRYEHGREGEILRCALHGWEFDIATGTCLTNPKVRAQKYPAGVEDGQVYVVA